MDIKEMCCIAEIRSVYCRVLEFVNSGISGYCVAGRDCMWR